MIDNNRLELIYALTHAEVKHGWLSKAKLFEMAKVYEELHQLGKPLVSVELGTFYGFSAIAQGLLIKDLNINCKLYAVDAWSKDASLEGSNSEANNEWWGNLNYDEIYNSFTRSIYALGLEHIIFPIKGKSLEVSSLLPDKFDIIHQDGNHSYEVVSSEIQEYHKRIEVGGYWIADDFRWVEMGGATNKLLELGFDAIKEYDKDGQSFAIYKKLTYL